MQFFVSDMYDGFRAIKNGFFRKAVRVVGALALAMAKERAKGYKKPDDSSTAECVTDYLFLKSHWRLTARRGWKEPAKGSGRRSVRSRRRRKGSRGYWPRSPGSWRYTTPSKPFTSWSRNRGEDASGGAFLDKEQVGLIRPSRGEEGRRHPGQTGEGDNRGLRVRRGRDEDHQRRLRGDEQPHIDVIEERLRPAVVRQDEEKGAAHLRQAKILIRLTVGRHHRGSRCFRPPDHTDHREARRTKKR